MHAPSGLISEGFGGARRLLALLVLAALVGACPGRSKRNLGGPTIALPAVGSTEARRSFESSRSQFERDASSKDSSEFEAIVRDYPGDPIVLHALLYGAMADMRGGRAAAALVKLDTLDRLVPAEGSDAMLLARAALFRGLALSSLQRHREARRPLVRGAIAVNQGDEQERSAWNAAMAEALVSAGEGAGAIRYYNAWWHGATKAERSYLLTRIRALVPSLGNETLARSYSELSADGGPGAVIVGGRWAEKLSELGRREESLRVLGETSKARSIIAEEEGGGLLGGSDAAGDAGLVGALLPLSGRLNRVGELSLRGLAVASGATFAPDEDSNEFSAFRLIARDTNSASSSVSKGLESLAAADALVAIGPFDGSAAVAVGPVAQRLDLPVLSLSPRGNAGGVVFDIRHSAESRARRLATYAYGKGISDFAIFSPQTAYGLVVARAFEDQVQSLGGAVVVHARYARGTTSFSAGVAKLKKPWSAIFVPDQAKVLALIAPALAAANFNARPVGKSSKTGRSILLLSTAEGIDRSFLRSAGRYSFGAIFAPGFYPDRTDPSIADFVARYEGEFGVEPSAHEAYAYDAAAIVRHAVDAGANSRASLLLALRSLRVEGLTGIISFGSDNRRQDRGLLFLMEQPIAGQYELRAMR